MMTHRPDGEHRETNSSGDHADPVNSSEDRLRADAALEPGLADAEPKIGNHK
jgi:hypothetical protein